MRGVPAANQKPGLGRRAGIACPSWPGLTRSSVPARQQRGGIAGRLGAGHDAGGVITASLVSLRRRSARGRWQRGTTAGAVPDTGRSVGLLQSVEGDLIILILARG